jgi:glucose/arabinose dehydrogenase
MDTASPVHRRRALALLAAGALVLAGGAALRLGLFDRTPAVPPRAAAPAYLAFPAQPVFATATRWTTEPAFPHVTFRNPVVMEPEPGTDRLFIGELEGTIQAISSRDPGTREKTTVLDLTRQTQGGFDSGLLGLAFHPEYGRTDSPNRDYVYVFYSWAPNPVMVGRPHHETVTWSRVSRFTMDRASGRLRPESEQVLIHQRKRIIFHVGGPLFFHPRDGFLYIAVGDEGGQQDSLNNAQRIDHNLFAGVLRIDVDRRGGSVSHPIRKQPADGETAHYFIPSDNPFVGVPGALEEFYAIGLRSPHRMTYDPVEDVAWIGEIGQAAREEIEVLQIGRAPQNFQWAFQEGSQKGFKPKPERPLGILTDAAWEYGRDLGRSVIGGYVYRGQRHPSLRGRYICADFANGRVWALTYARVDGVIKVTGVDHLATGEGFRNYHGGIGGITSFGLDHQNELYVLRHGHATRIERLVESAPRPGNVPPLLSQTGAFADVRQLQPVPGLVPYEVRVPQWLNGASARRWIAVPAGKKIGFDPTGPWRFPAGTVFVEHLDWSRQPGVPEATRPLETRFLVVSDGGGTYGVTYRWRADRSDADLVAHDDVSESLETRGEKGERVRVLWVYPSPKDCLQCHTPGAGYVLGVRTRQLNRDTLAAWSEQGLLAGAPRGPAADNLPRLAPLDDSATSLETRVRSYVDANCAHCHGATAIHSAWNANFNLPLASQGIIGGAVLGHRPDPHHFIVAPGDPARSELYQRVSENIIGKRMPPLGNDRVDEAFVRVLREWIDGLPAPAPASRP